MANKGLLMNGGFTAQKCRRKLAELKRRYIHMNVFKCEAEK